MGKNSNTDGFPFSPGMDELMEVSFSPLAATGKPLSRCGKCHRFMKYIQVSSHRVWILYFTCWGVVIRNPPAITECGFKYCYQESTLWGGGERAKPDAVSPCRTNQSGHSWISCKFWTLLTIQMFWRFAFSFQAKPSRLHCSHCDDTYSLPQNGTIKLYKELRCPLDDFELVLWSSGSRGKSYPLCPYCYNHPPFRDMKKGKINEMQGV